MARGSFLGVRNMGPSISFVGIGHAVKLQLHSEFYIPLADDDAQRRDSIGNRIGYLVVKVDLRDGLANHSSRYKSSSEQANAQASALYAPMQKPAKAERPKHMSEMDCRAP